MTVVHRKPRRGTKNKPEVRFIADSSSNRYINMSAEMRCECGCVTDYSWSLFTPSETTVPCDYCERVWRLDCDEKTASENP